MGIYDMDRKEYMKKKEVKKPTKAQPKYVVIKGKAYEIATTEPTKKKSIKKKVVKEKEVKRGAVSQFFHNAGKQSLMK